jgi:hypothetical protein
MCRVSEYGDPLLSYNYIYCKICIRLFLCIKDVTFGRWRGFRIFANKVQISPPNQKGICTNMTMLISLVCKLTQFPLASLLEHVMGIFPTVGTHCMRFYSSCTMVVKLWKYIWTWCVVYWMSSRPPNPTLKFQCSVLQKRHRP